MVNVDQPKRRRNKKKMQARWGELPLLPLKCILDHLSLDDALAVMSTCKQWRSAMLLYEGHRDKLELKATEMEKNLLLARIFRKHTRVLHVYIDCSEEEFEEKFMNFVLPQFFDSINLKEVVIVGPMYIQHESSPQPSLQQEPFQTESFEEESLPLLSFLKLKRIIMESFLYKHSKCIEKLAILGCELGDKNDNDRYVHKTVKYYSKPLSFNSVTSPGDAILSSSTIDLMKLSTLKHMIVEYDFMSTESLVTLSRLSNLRMLTLNIIFKKGLQLRPIDWDEVNSCYPNRIDVAVNLISVPHSYFSLVMERVFVAGLPLVSFKAMFCRTLFSPLLNHMSRTYRNTLSELVWVDAPDPGGERSRRVRPSVGEVLQQMNPFILICWQCVNLKRLVIHGYWIWYYDVIGFLRLRKSLRLEVSSVYGREELQPNPRLRPAHCHPHPPHDAAVRVLVQDGPHYLENVYIQEVNKFANYRWRPLPWRQLHSSLKPRASARSRAQYIAFHVLHRITAYTD